MAIGRKTTRKSPTARYSKRGVHALARLGRNMRDTATLASHSSEVINSRLTDVNCGELARMGPEKVLAAMSAGAAWMRSAYRLSTVFYRDAAQEAMTVLATAREMAMSPLPTALE